MMRLLTGLTLTALLIGVLGCSNKAQVLPTDEEAKKRAMETPPPPQSFGGPGATPTSPQKGPGGQQKVDLKGVGQ